MFSWILLTYPIVLILLLITTAPSVQTQFSDSLYYPCACMNRNASTGWDANKIFKRFLLTFSVSKEIKEKAEKFWQDWKDDKRKMLQSVVDLEEVSMNKGYSLAISFVSGHCQLCEKCNTQIIICGHPNLARWSEDAVGVNVKKTADNAGITDFSVC